MTSKKPLISDILRVLLPIGILGLGMGVLVFSILNRPVPATQPERKIIPAVKTVGITSFDGDLTISVDGTVVPYREINLAAEVTGRIVEKADDCRPGRFVRADEPLFAIDPADYRLEVKRLTQEKRQTEVSLQETQVEIENTRRLLELAENDVKIQNNDVTRMQKLISQRAVSETELDRALRGSVTARNALQIIQNRLRLLNAQLDGVKATLDLAKTKLELADLNLARTQIKSPIDGVIVQEMVQRDSYVQKGTTLVRIEDTSAVEVICNLRTDQLVWLWRSADSLSPSVAAGSDNWDLLAGKYELPSAQAEVVYRIDGREFVWQGVVSRYDGIGLDERTRTVPCRILVPDPTAVRLRTTRTVNDAGTPTDREPLVGGPTALIRGMFVNVHIKVPTSDGTLLRLPIEAVRPGDRVWIAAEGRLRMAPVRIAQVHDDEALIVAGDSELKSDDRVIVSPLPAALAGMEIREAATP
jgi:multidrug efflux pump subunit AcrA (membrane-fusion protein)